MPPGTQTSGWILRPPTAAMISWPNCRRRMPLRATSGLAEMSPKMFRVSGGQSKPSSRSGLDKWKKLRACDWIICPMCIRSRSMRAVGVGLTPQIASTALAAARWWLTGQIPQIRSVRVGISEKCRRSQNFSNPRNSTTWKRAAVTFPSSSRWMVTRP